jgi:cytochrome c-type biogenesis protein CcmH
VKGAGYLLLIAAMSLLAGSAGAIDADEMFADPRMEQRAREVGRQLRCLVCQNESIFDSNADLARDLRMLVRRRIEAGDRDAQILDYVVDRYGDYVLLKPPLRGATLVLWAAPLLLLTLAVAAGAAYLRHRRTPLPGDEEELARGREALRGDPS